MAIGRCCPSRQLIFGRMPRLNMGDGELLGAVLSHVFSSRPERGSALILSGETGTLYEGLILDQGSDDYLQVEELAGALAGRGVDLLVLDSGFSAGFEFLYEIGKTLEEPPLMLLSPGALSTGRQKLRPALQQLPG